MVVPPFLKTGLRPARACALTPGRMPSSSLITTSFSLPCVRADALSVLMGCVCDQASESLETLPEQEPAHNLYLPKIILHQPATIGLRHAAKLALEGVLKLCNVGALRPGLQVLAAALKP